MSFFWSQIIVDDSFTWHAAETCVCRSVEESQPPSAEITSSVQPLRVFCAWTRLHRSHKV